MAVSALARPDVRVGYLMVDSFHIRNFRSFADVLVDDCRRFNIVVGDNGSGKTALLEALFLAAGTSPELVLRTSSWRGVEYQTVTATTEDLERGLWADLFHNFKTNQPATVALTGTDAHTRSVTVSFQKAGSGRIIPPSRKSPVRVSPTIVREPPKIRFLWKIKNRPSIEIVPVFLEGKLQIPPSPEVYLKGALFSSTHATSNQEINTRFSKLSRIFAEQEFIDKFREHFPRISTLSIEYFLGSSVLAAGVENIPEKIALGMASGGMNKLAAILLTMAEQAGGVILIDEIENGFYYERLPFILSTILDFANRYDCQVFASTHSQECLRAVAQLSDKHPEDFCLLRTVIGSEGSKIRRFDGEQFAHAVLDSVEVR